MKGQKMTDEQINLIVAASILRTSAAELYAVLNFVGREVIAEVRTDEFMSKHNSSDLMIQATAALQALAAKARDFRNCFDQIIERREHGILKSDFLHQAFSTWSPPKTFERPKGNVIDFASARRMLRPAAFADKG